MSAEMTSPPAASVGAPRVTVFTSTVYPDLVRIWHACVRRAFPREEAKIEVFYDSEAEPPAAEHLPGVTLLRRGPGRRDFHEAYNDAVARCDTPYLAFVDSDVFWTSLRLWPRVRRQLEERPRLAAVSCVSRWELESHGTFAVVLRAAAYRKAFEKLPGGFFPAFENLDPERPREEWTEYDAGDLATRAVKEDGWEIELMNLERRGELVRFDGITLTRRGGEWLGEATLARMARRRRYFWRGYIGNLVLGRLHGRLFPAGPPYRFPYRGRALLLETVRADPRRIPWRLGYLRRLRAGARRVEGFLAGAPDPPE